MEDSLFRHELAATQESCLAGIKRTGAQDIPGYAKDYLGSIARKAGLTEREARLVDAVVSAFPIRPKPAAAASPASIREGSSAGQRALGQLTVALSAFILALLGALINPFFAGLFAVAGIPVGRLVSRAAFGKSSRSKGKATPTAQGSECPFDTEDVYNQMASLAGTLDCVLAIFRQERGALQGGRPELGTDILLAIQKLIGSSVRGDAPDVTRSYIRDIEEILPLAGIEVLHYSEENADAFEAAAGTKHGVEVLPAFADRGGVILPGKYVF